ncbi:MAG TPA: PIN domain-containing protein [Gemmataceae bacterium]
MAQVLLDTGVLVRFLHSSDPDYPVIQQAIAVLSGRGDVPVMFTQNLAEFWNVCTRPATARGGFGLSVAETEKRLLMLEGLFPILDDTPAAYPIWKRLIVSHAVQGVQVHDARLVALMTAHGLTQILTLNPGDFSRYPGVTPLTPSALVRPGP